MKEQFTREQVIQAAKKKYGKSVCVDRMDEALKANTLAEAVDIILNDSRYWDNSYRTNQRFNDASPFE